ncbi:MAG: hypothetical protein H6585_15625 [Flavobacteriales bacterium]|nr:hypothetical protein [Flavobacteriales bacterium]
MQKTTTSPQLNVPPKGNVPPGKTPPPPGSTGTPPVGTAGKPEGKKEEKKSGKRVLLILLIISAILNVLLLAGGGYTVVKYDNQVDSLSTYGNELRTELDQTMEDLDQYKGQSEKLDKMLAAAKLELDTTRVKIEKMLAEGNQDKETIDQLRHELRRIKRKREKFEEEIDRLLLENRELKSKNLDLSVAVGNLEEEKEVLSEKVTIASKIPVEYATITGLKMKGKAFKETALAKKVEKFSICFDVMENKVVEPGNKVLYLRISGPAGEVLGNKELGSGSFVDAESGKEKLFTVQKDIDYRNDRQNYCVDWEDPSKETYDPGTYVAEFYLDGFKAGTTSFILR